ncbi:MAG: hypothetical protein HKL79_01500 [Thermoplasmata archaeon]|nr:hypothetical protein [Thermoplasmata archaeon]
MMQESKTGSGVLPRAAPKSPLVPPASPTAVEPAWRDPLTLTSRSIEFDEDSLPEHFFRQLVAAYLSGADEITIESRARLPKAAPAVVQIFLGRIGTGVVYREGAGQFVIRGLDAFDHHQFSSMTRHLGEAVLERLRLAGSDPSAPIAEGKWEAEDDSIDRWAWAVHRQVVRCWEGRCPEGWADEDRIDPIGWLEASRALERIGDHAVAIGIHAGRWKATQPPESERALLAAFHGQACDYLANTLGLLGETQISVANSLLDQGEALRETTRTLVDRLLVSREGSTVPSPAAVVAIGWVLHSLERVIAYATDIAEVGLDRAVAMPSSASSQTPSFNQGHERRKPKQ